MPTMTAEEKAREVERLKDPRQWPLYPRIPVKRFRKDESYEFGIVLANGDEPVPVVFNEGVHEAKFESIEAMVDAGWMVD
jgi:hypothetical protein